MNRLRIIGVFIIGVIAGYGVHYTAWLLLASGVVIAALMWSPVAPYDWRVGAAPPIPPTPEPAPEDDTLGLPERPCND